MDIRFFAQQGKWPQKGTRAKQPDYPRRLAAANVFLASIFLVFREGATVTSFL
jgi:hypothetical protein